MPICKYVVESKTTSKKNKRKCSFELNNYERVYLFIIVVSLIVGVFNRL